MKTLVSVCENENLIEENISSEQMYNSFMVIVIIGIGVILLIICAIGLCVWYKMERKQSNKANAIAMQTASKGGVKLGDDCDDENDGVCDNKNNKSQLNKY